MASQFHIGSTNQEDRLPTLRDRDIRVRLLQLYVLFVGSVLVGAFVLDAVITRQLEQDVRSNDAGLAAEIVREIDNTLVSKIGTLDQLAVWIEIIASDRSGAVLVFDGEGDVRLRLGAVPQQESLWRGWQNQIVRRAINEQFDSFANEAPDGSQWVSSHATGGRSGWHVVVQRPTDQLQQTTAQLHRGIFYAAVVYLVGGVVFWLVLSNQLISPMVRFESFSSLVRWRGKAQPEEQFHLDQLSQRRDQIGGLSRSLVAMAKDIDDRFMQLSTLLETSRIVAASLDVSEVSDNILEQVQRLFNVERCSIVALDKRAGVFRIRASRGLTEAYVKQLRIAPSEPNSPSMRALRNKEPIQVADTETDLAFADSRGRARQEEYRSVLAVPLLTKHAPPAVLVLFKSTPYRYSYSELELATSFANHAAIAMENAALHALTDEQLQEQTQRLEAIVESLDDGLILESVDGELIYTNQRACNLVGLPRSEVRRSTPHALLEELVSSAADPKAARQAVMGANGEARQSLVDLERRDKDNRPQDLRIHFFDVKDAHGELMGQGQLWQDITRDKEIDRVKSTLITTVSHELRTPLAAIKGFATTLLADDVQWDATAQREFLQTISDETDRLTGLVKNLLDMSRLEAGTLEMHCRPFALDEIIAKAARRVESLPASRLNLDLDSSLPLVNVDVSRMETVVRNLLENAVKYSPPDKPIELTAHRENGFITVQVRDYGAGVPQDHRTKVFDRFFRADNRLTRRTSGVGMGLSICRGFVEAHGGRVWVEDGRPGAIFSFTLPVIHDISQ